MGYLLSAFLWAYAFSQLPCGALVDRLGPRALLTLGLSAWSIAQGLGGLVQTMSQFVGARILLGIGEAPQFPTGARVVRDWFNARDRGLATGIFNCASTLGNAIAAPLLTAIMLSVGWRWMFGIMGIAGLALAAVWWTIYRNPQELDLDAQEQRLPHRGRSRRGRRPRDVCRVAAAVPLSAPPGARSAAFSAASTSPGYTQPGCPAISRSSAT